MSSDAGDTFASDEVSNETFVTPRTGLTAPSRRSSSGGVRVSGGRMASKFGGTGRPSNAEIERQETEFRALIAQGMDIDDAARVARIKPERALAVITPIVRSLLARAA